MGISEYLQIVYYSNFWYSRYYKQSRFDFGANIVKDESDLHKFQLRLLSLFFDEIYIPRTHLITQSISIQHRIPDVVLDSNEFKYLFEQGIIRVSSAPDLDEKQDNERILSRKSDSERVLYPSDEQFLAKIPITKRTEVDTTAESQKNAADFPQYGEILMPQNRALSEKYMEAIKRAERADLPFMHEHFVATLSSSVDRENFEKLWRETNSMYLVSGAPELPNMVPFFNEEIESVNFRFVPNDVDRYLFSPSSLYGFLSLYLNDDSVGKFLYGPIEKVMSKFHSELTRVERVAFRHEFQSIVRQISYVTRRQQYRANLDQTFVKALFELLLDDQFSKDQGIAGSVLDDIGAISKVADAQSAGIAAMLARSGLRFGQTALQKYTRNRKYPHIARAMQAIKAGTKDTELV